MESSPDLVTAGGNQSSLPAVQSHCLMNISLVKLHRSLHHVEPNLRHLVLVANTLRRLQDNMHAESATTGEWRGLDDPTRRDYAQPLATESKKPLPESVGEEALLSIMDSSLYSSISAILEESNSFQAFNNSPLSQLEDDQLCSLKDPKDGSRDDTGKPIPSPSLLSSSTYLVGDNLEDIFEDIDTSMYDSDPWSSANLLNFKAFSNVEDPEKSLEDGNGGMLELSELDYLMDVLVGSQNS
uniref:SERTA domain-containing protein n=1 Tax=Leptobrachium leishanense TaxID=445787 RepID=A0A8C5QNC0_9ANUR